VLYIFGAEELDLKVSVNLIGCLGSVTASTLTATFKFEHDTSSLEIPQEAQRDRDVSPSVSCMKGRDRSCSQPSGEVAYCGNTCTSFAVKMNNVLPAAKHKIYTYGYTLLQPQAGPAVSR
jgi:hypothetical protein